MEADGAGPSELETGKELVLWFVRDQLQRCPDSAAQELGRALLGKLKEWSPHIQEMGELLRKVGDKLDSDVDLQRLIDRVYSAPRDVFFRVAKEMFADGKLSWGRVVTFLYFCGKVIIKALCTRLDQLFQTLLDWTLQFLKERFLPWIIDQGGWCVMLTCAASIITASFTLIKML